jgi:hypothetical protein
MKYLLFVKQLFPYLLVVFFLYMLGMGCDGGSCKSKMQTSLPPGDCVSDAFHRACCGASCKIVIPSSKAAKDGILTYTVVSDHYHLPLAIKVSNNNGDTVYTPITFEGWSATFHVKQGSTIFLSACYDGLPSTGGAYYQLYGFDNILISKDSAQHTCTN